LLDCWEQNGFDANLDGAIDVDLPAFGARSDHKDLFLELDWMIGQEPRRAAIQAVKAAFKAAPVNAGGRPNPDGQPGINLWIDTGSLTDPLAREDSGPPGSCGDGIDNGSDGLSDFDGNGNPLAADLDCLVGDNLGGGNGMPVTNMPSLMHIYVEKSLNFKWVRRLLFRYAISAQGQAGWGGGWGELGGNDFIEYNHDAGTIMHELGHTLGLDHGGNTFKNCNPNYVSVMSYFHQFGIFINGGGGQDLDGDGIPGDDIDNDGISDPVIIDYSPPRLPGSEDGAGPLTCGDGVDNGGDGLADFDDPNCALPAGRGAVPLPLLRENDLDETMVLDPSDPSNQFVFINGNTRITRSPLDQAPDWNGNGVMGEQNLTVNIDTSDLITGRPANCTNDITDDVLAGHDDWPVISLPFRQFGDFKNAPINPITEPEPDLTDRLLLRRALNTTDIVVTKTDLPDPTAAGTSVTYTIVVANAGPNPAAAVRVTDPLPAGMSFVSASSECSHASGTVTCDLGSLRSRESRQVTVTVGIDADLVYKAGGPVSINNTATGDNLAGPDPEPANDAASATTTVIAVTDLEIVSVEADTAGGMALIGVDTSITVRKRIRNNGPSGPVDASLTATTTAAAGAMLSPSTLTISAKALTLGELRVVEETFMVRCQEPSLHPFLVTNVLEPMQSADKDPNPSNNRLETSFQVECVVPVSINIKPFGSPNAVQPKERSVPVAVLTTVAGEYGNPVAFDATTILPQTVRFGPRSLVLNGGGGAEIHGRGHVEDSSEPDEKTRDGDADMMLHFEASASGIRPGVTEACVFGRWVDAVGRSHTFLGCDEVRVVPP
jgi:uncharacterized repeat protein (TIGR01451 family)